MQIVIDIDEDVFNRFKDNDKPRHMLTSEERIEVDRDAICLTRAICNGIPLPKGHGRLIILSEDAVKRKQTPLSFSYQNWISEVDLSNATVAIIEADKEKE